MSIISFIDNYIKFILLSEMCWLNIYAMGLILSSVVEDCSLYSFILLILVLTAIECIVLWGLVFLIKKNQ